MKAFITSIIASLAPTSSVLAASGIEPESNSLFLWLFLGFGALIVLYQMAPGLMLLGSMIKGFFSTASK